MASLGALRKSAGIRTLLSPLNSNPKTAKNEKLNVSTAVLHLAPGDMSGHEVCPKRSPGCSAACLHFAGNPVYQDAKTKARIKKTKLFFWNRNLFMNILALEMVSHILNARKKCMTPAFRLNATSDIVWEKKTFILFPETAAIINKKLPEADITAKTIIALFPASIFYDYTAIPNRSAPSNYYLTFSLKEQNLHDARGAIRQGFNIAVVFPVGVLPDMYLGLPVIDGDRHDYRPSDPSLCVVGLKAKGKTGKGDISGFVQRDQMLIRGGYIRHVTLDDTPIAA